MARPGIRLSTLLASLAVAASLLVAGCVGTAAAASAKDNKGAADAAAKAWDPNAQLAQIVGVEGTLGAALSLMGVSGAGDFGSARDDQNVGDGLAEVWAYRYVAPSKAQAYVVVVGKDGGVTRQGTEAKRAEDRPLGAWEIDSDDALRVALDANEGLRNGVGRGLFGVVSVLHQEGGANAVWLVAGGGADASGGGGGHVLLDALTGKVLSSEGGFGDAGRSWMG